MSEVNSSESSPIKNAPEGNVNDEAEACIITQQEVIEHV